MSCILLAGCVAKNEKGQVQVRIALVGALQTQQMPITLANSLGYYQAEGLDVTFENLSSNGKTLEALVGGSVDVAATAYTQTIQMAAVGQHLRSFFIGVRRSSFTLVVAPKATGRIRRVEDLKGALIGVPAQGSPTLQWVNYLLGVHGMHPSEVRAVGVGVAASVIAAIESGRIDVAGLTGGDHIRVLRRIPAAQILVDGSTPEGMRETFGGDLYASGALTARQEWLDRNPATARKLARALQRTLVWIAGHTPKEIRERLPEAIRSPDAAVDLEIMRWSLATYTADGRMPVGAPETMKRYLDATVESVRDSKIDLAATWTNEFLPESK